jgi:hypothetical protein
VSPAASAVAIYGFPSTITIAGRPYLFKATAADSNGKPLVFTIINKPSWAAFDSTGQLWGNPGNAAVGNYYNIIISVSDGTTTASLPEFSIQVLAADQSPPVISGVPPTRVSAGTTYRFQPSARDAAGNRVWFGIQNKPSWATFRTDTGLLTGTPTNADVGTYRNISIHVTDGEMSGATSAFDITVEPNNSGTATLYWTGPTQLIDGAALTNLAGYRLYYGKSPLVLSSVVQLADASLSTYTLRNLGTATWYFGIKAYTSTGAESHISQIVSKSVN